MHTPMSCKILTEWILSIITIEIPILILCEERVQQFMAILRNDYIESVYFVRTRMLGILSEVIVDPQ